MAGPDRTMGVRDVESLKRWWPLVAILALAFNLRPVAVAIGPATNGPCDCKSVFPRTPGPDAES